MNAKWLAAHICGEIDRGVRRGVFKCNCGRWIGWFVVPGFGDPAARVEFTDHSLMVEGGRLVG